MEHKLYNNHNVYILGAGFSVDRGLPTIKNFMVVMRDAHEWLESQNRQSEADSIKAVLDFRLDAAAAAYRIKLDLENIEELFSLASASESASKLTKHIRTAIAATLDYRMHIIKEPVINLQVNDAYADIPNSWQIASDSANPKTSYVTCPAYEFYLKSLIGDWNSQNKTAKNTIISFNYDLIIENSLKKLSIPFSYGFEDDILDASENMKLLKLHGSVNWGKKQPSSTTYDIHNNYEDLRKARQSPQLVPPTWRKVFTGQLRQIWDNSLRSLENATRIIVIGFSMPDTDSHFKYLMAAGLQKNVSLREIIFVNPDKETVISRAKTLFGDSSIIGQQNSYSSIVDIIGKDLSSFITQGTSRGLISAYGRPLPREFQNINTSR